MLIKERDSNNYVFFHRARVLYKSVHGSRINVVVKKVGQVEGSQWPRYIPSFTCPTTCPSTNPSTGPIHVVL